MVYLSHKLALQQKRIVSSWGKAPSRQTQQTTYTLKPVFIFHIEHSLKTACVDQIRKNGFSNQVLLRQLNAIRVTYGSITDNY